MSPRPHGLIRITPGYSRSLAIYLLTLHLSAFAVLLLLHLPLVLNTILSGAIVASLFHSWRRDLLHRGRAGIGYVRWSEEGGWLIRDGYGEKQLATLTPSSFLSPYLVLLRFTTDNSGKHRLVLPADAVDPDLMRRLRVLLRMRDHFGV
jgi:hypothetical protein